MRSEDVTSVDFSQRPFVIRGTDTSVRANSVIVATGATAKRSAICPPVRTPDYFRRLGTQLLAEHNCEHITLGTLCFVVVPCILLGIYYLGHAVSFVFLETDWGSRARTNSGVMVSVPAPYATVGCAPLLCCLTLPLLSGRLL